MWNDSIDSNIDRNLIGVNIASLCDRALVAYIIAQKGGTAADVFPAKRSEVKILPCTICWAHSFVPCDENPYSGNFDVEAFIEVRTPAVIEDGEQPDDPRKAADLRTASTFNLFLVEVGQQAGANLGEAITSAARATLIDDLQNFTIQNCVIVGGNQGFNPRVKLQQGNAWIDSLHLQLQCCPKDVS